MRRGVREQHDSRGVVRTPLGNHVGHSACFLAMTMRCKLCVHPQRCCMTHASAKGKHGSHPANIRRRPLLEQTGAWGLEQTQFLLLVGLVCPGHILNLVLVGPLHETVARSALQAGRAHERLIGRRVAGLLACEQSGRSPMAAPEATQEPLEANGVVASEHSNLACHPPLGLPSRRSSVAARCAGLEWASIALVPLGLGGRDVARAGRGRPEKKAKRERRQSSGTSGGWPTPEASTAFNPAVCRWRFR